MLLSAWHDSGTCSSISSMELDMLFFKKSSLTNLGVFFVLQEVENFVPNAAPRRPTEGDREPTQQQTSRAQPANQNGRLLKKCSEITSEKKGRLRVFYGTQTGTAKVNTPPPLKDSGHYW